MRTALSILTLLTLALTASPLWAEPFAPKVDVPAAMLDSRHEAYTKAVGARDAEIPSRAEVGLPAFPGAKIMFTQRPTAWEINGKQLKTLHRIYMGSKQPKNEIVSFYKAKLPGWGHVDKGGVHYFWKGNGPFDPFGESGVVTPRVVVGEPFKHRKDPLMPDMQSVIEIYYRK